MCLDLTQAGCPTATAAASCVASLLLDHKNKPAMRIIGTIPHPVYLVTVFQMGERLALKVEHNLLELTWKFREGQVDSFDALQALLDDAFFAQAAQLFAAMERERARLLSRTREGSDEDELPDLI